MGRRTFTLSTEHLKERLGIAADKVVLQIDLDHRIGQVEVTVEDHESGELPEGVRPMPESLR